ncbi:MAG: LrgB family protein [Marinospirillum sp.]|uniref:LrgB family protein n=1 Tax=Marinospirillum sp. TaxID=2183934 RepID=UPI0019DC6AAE|nr:LrgB family protein [Marinospirillum sp.]MBE0505844.1 LrgB family protein [Marinospirillum sp.]
MIQVLVTHPLFGLLVTLIGYQLAMELNQRTRSMLAQPVLVATLLVVGMLLLLDVDFETYYASADLIWLILGPTTVALAVPLYTHLRRIRDYFWPLLTALLVGGFCTVLLTLGFAWLLGADQALLASLAPKSVTSPIAILLAEDLGGSPALAAVFVMITGVAGAVMALPLLKLAGINLPAARGFTLGLNAHAAGTAVALEEGEETGAFAALAMSLTGAVTAILLPLFYNLAG